MMESEKDLFRPPRPDIVVGVRGGVVARFGVLISERMSSMEWSMEMCKEEPRIIIPDNLQYCT